MGTRQKGDHEIDSGPCKAGFHWAELLQEHPEVEWYLWIDSDTMIINPTFEMPLRKFKGKDLVIWGNETALLEGDGRNGGALAVPPTLHSTLSAALLLNAPLQ